MVSIKHALCGALAVVVTMGGPTGAQSPAQGAAAPIPRLRPEPSHLPAQTGVVTPAGQTAGQQTPVDRTVLDRYCVTCHNEKLKTAGLALDRVDLSQPGAHAEILEKVVQKLRTGQMPPTGRPRPDPATGLAFVTSLESSLDAVSRRSPDPGRIPIHRLNRTEYVNAIRDLFALEIDGAAMLPADTPGLGFDNNADVLSVTPGLMARYLTAATKISRMAIGDTAIRPISQVYRVAEFARQDSRMSDDLPFATRGGLAIRHTFPLDGEYGFKLRLQRNQVGNTIRGMDHQHEIEVRVDRALVKRFTIGGEAKGSDLGILIAISEDEVEAQRMHTYRLTADDALEFRVALKAGTQTVSAAFVDEGLMYEGVPIRSRSIKSSSFTDDASDPGIDTVEISGPYNGLSPENSPSRQKIFVCRPTGARDEDVCARRILTTMTRRAYRRPITDADVASLFRIYKAGRTERDFDTGIQRALEAMLASPSFLFQLERDPVGVKPGTSYRLSDVELASRLSFFLWASVPDDELLDVAARGRLKEPAVLDQQVRRMLADPRATRWMTNFVDQWLIIRNVLSQEPDPNMFPDYDDTLRDAILKETELFFESQVRGNRSVLDLLRADYTFMNARLAEHYSVPDIYGSHFRRVPIADPVRQGLLGHASVLLVTSYAHRTSVVGRGKWVLENLLGAPPPAPPPNVPPLKENDGKGKATSLRERMEQHRANAVCATCHSRIDPMGFPLEHFDATGRWRKDDMGAPIDPVSTLPDGTKVDGATSLRNYLLENRSEFVRTLTEKLFTFALGRGPEYYDAPTIRQLVRDAEAVDYRWDAVILGLVKSAPFQMRRAGDAPVISPTVTAQANQ